MAKVYRIKGLRKLHIAGIANVNDFVTRYEGELDFGDYWKKNKNSLTPFCFDYENRSVVFVETPVNINLLTVHPFFYEAQRHHATKLYQVSFETVTALMEDIGDFEDSKPLFLFSTGRCGSTLLCNLMADNSDMVSVSEADFFTQLPYLRDQYGEEVDDELSQLSRALTLLLQAYIKTHSNDATIVFKLRSMCLEAAELIAGAVPEADHVYLYRNANDTINSFLSVLSAHPLLSFARRLNSRKFPLLDYIPLGMISYVPGLKRNVEVFAPLIKELDYRGVGIGTGASIFTLAWLSSLDKALALQKEERGFFKCVVRYDELRSDAFETMEGVMASLDCHGIDESAKERMRSTLQKDSQAGSEMSSKGEKVLSDKDLCTIERVLGKHAQISSADFLVPDPIS